MRPVVGLALCLLLILCPASARAGEPVNPAPPLHPGQDRPPLPNYLPSPSDDGVTTPPAPERRDVRPGDGSIQLKGLEIDGATVFPDAELKAVAAPFIGKPVTVADLEEIRYRLTRFYVDEGYVNSGAVLTPGQRVDDGVVSYRIEEGRLDRISVSGNGRLRPNYIRKRLWPDPDRPFNTAALQKRFQLLLQDPLIDRMNGRIRPGLGPGEAVLDLDVDRAQPYALSILTDNHRPPSTGAEQVSLAGAIWNPTGFGDLLEASAGLSEGGDEIAVGYTLPITARDTRLSFRYSRTENAVVEEPLKLVDVESEAESAEVGLTHPVIRTLGRTLELGVTLAIRESQTFIDWGPFSYEEGPVEGKSQVTAVRLVQSFVDRSPDTALAFRSTLSLGVDLFGPTIGGGDQPDGRFLAWLGQAQYALRLGDRFGQVLLRGDVQLAEDRLLSLERFAVGGAGTVRGYRENARVRDGGYVLSAEWRYPLLRRETGDGPADILRIAPFMDFGDAWNRGESDSDDPLHSVGVGLLWTPSRWLDAEIYFAHDLNKAEDSAEHDFQDEGVHFRVRLNAY